MNLNDHSLLPGLWMESGLTQADFCRERGVCLSTFQYWRRKEREKSAENPGNGSFVPVQVKSGSSGSGLAALEIQLPGELLVRLPDGLSVADLAFLISELRRAC